MPGMRLVSINKLPVSELQMEEVLAAIEAAGRPLDCTFMLEDSCYIDHDRSYAQQIVDTLQFQVATAV